MHPICSLMASIDLADELDGARRASPARTASICPGVPGDNLAARALADFRSRAGRELPPLELTIDKRIPVAAGLGGGSADAAAALRIANEMAGGALDAAGAAQARRRPRLRRAEPARPAPRARAGRRRAGGAGRAAAAHRGAGAGLARDSRRPRCTPSSTGSAGAREQARPGAAARRSPAPGRPTLAAGLENDLQPAALSLRPDLTAALERLRSEGALGAAVSGSGPTCFGLFDDPRRRRVGGRVDRPARSSAGFADVPCRPHVGPGDDRRGGRRARGGVRRLALAQAEPRAHARSAWSWCSRWASTRAACSRRCPTPRR